MRGRQAALRILGALAACGGCARTPDEDMPKVTLAVPDASTRATAPASAAATAKALAVLREHALELPPRDAPAQRIAFGAGRFAQLGEQELVVRNTGDYAVILAQPVQDPRAVTELADGSLLVATGDALYHLERKATAVKRYPRVVLLPGSLLLPDRKEPTRFFSFHTVSGSLYPHVLEPSESPLLPFGDVSELGVVSRGAFTPLKDGSFLYASDGALSRVFPRGKKLTFKLPPRPGEIQRLLTTRRIDQAWSVWSDRQLELFQVAPRLASVKTLPLLPHVFDAASSDRFVALLCWENRPAGPRRWSLSVIDGDGQKRFEIEVPGEPATGAGEAWVAAVTRNKTLVLSNREPLVAVGGPTTFTIWNIEQGRAAFSHAEN
jgi:hypothetical protein